MEKLLVNGFIAGLIAGFVMGLCSEIGFRLGLFRASLARIDGTFAGNIMGHRLGFAQLYVIGAVMHLITSAVFGAIFGLLVFVLGVRADLPLLACYVFLLWLSMLCTALPIAGQGFMGKRLGPYTWLEQLVLHIIYGIVFARLIL